MLLVCPFAGHRIARSAAKVVDPAVFKEPPAEYRGHEMYGYGQFNLSNLSEERIRSDVDTMAKRNMGGLPSSQRAPLPGLPDDYLRATGRKPSSEGTVYLSDEYFKFYRAALEEARKNHLEVILYDEWAYPTGMVDGQLYAKYPQYVAKSLEMVETKRDRPGPDGIGRPRKSVRGRRTHEPRHVRSGGHQLARAAPGGPLGDAGPQG